MITYLDGDITKIQVLENGINVICQIVNDDYKYGAGVSGAIGNQYPVVPASYHAWCRKELRIGKWEELKGYRVYSGECKLGFNQYIAVQNEPRKPNIVVVNMMAQKGVGLSRGVPPLRYEALADCLNRLMIMYQESENILFHMPKIGSGLGHGDWPTIEGIIQWATEYREVLIYQWEKK